MNASHTYYERNKIKDIGEQLFEKYCKEKNYNVVRLGFDSHKDPIKEFFKINPLLRNIPDYVVEIKQGFTLSQKLLGCVLNYLDLLRGGFELLDEQVFTLTHTRVVGNEPDRLARDRRLKGHLRFVFRRDFLVGYVLHVGLGLGALDFNQASVRHESVRGAS